MIFIDIWIACAVINTIFTGVVAAKSKDLEEIRNILLLGLILGPVWTLLVIGVLAGGMSDK